MKCGLRTLNSIAEAVSLPIIIESRNQGNHFQILSFCLKSSASTIHVYRLLFASDECNYRIRHILKRIKACKKYFQWEASNMLGQDK